MKKVHDLHFLRRRVFGMLWRTVIISVANTLFAVILLGGLLWGKSFLKSLMGSMFPMTDQGWRVLTLRWAMFFVVLALLNEIVWRNASTDAWVSFKVFGIMPLTILFSILQLPTMNRYRQAGDIAKSKDGA